MPVEHLTWFMGFADLQLLLFLVDKHKNLDFFRQAIKVSFYFILFYKKIIAFGIG